MVNKIDEITTEKLFKTIDEFKDIYPFVEVVPTSGLKNDNVDHLISVIKKYLHDEVKYFPDEYGGTGKGHFFRILKRRKR